jgi:glutathione S-transferase
MALDLYWGSGSPYAWRVMLALEYKGLAYSSYELQFAKLEHKSAAMLRMNPRGRVPVLKDGDYVCFESLAILLYLDEKYPEPSIFGKTPEEAGTVMRVICEYQAYVEHHLTMVISAIFLQTLESRMEEVNKALGAIAKEARTLEKRLSSAEWLVGDAFSAADICIFPGMQLLLRALNRAEAGDLRGRLLPLDTHYPGILAWSKRIEGLRGYQRTYPPHWLE